MGTAGQIKGIYRYPVKGLSPESLRSVALVPGETLPADRMFAIENGPSGFDPAKPAYFPKLRFLMLMRNERLAELDTSFEEGTQTLSIRHGDGEAVAGDLHTPAGRSAIEQFFARFCAADLRGPPKVLHAPGHSFSDVARKVVSIINLASVAEVAGAIGAPVDPLRFRGNLYVEGWPAWREFDLLGRELAAGTAVRLRVVKRIVRCAATNVDPHTGARDLTIPETLMRNFGHADCGIYAEVIAGGTIAVGNEIGAVSDVGLSRDRRAEA
jgi:MOSC domain-containing protein